MYEGTDDITALMEEPPGGENHGFVSSSYVDDDGGVRVVKTPLDPRFAQLERGSYGVVSGKEDGGLVAHRGVTAQSEYVDTDVLKGLIEEALGFTYDEIGSVYRQGPLSDNQRQLRARIDARLLALSRSGGNMTALAKALGWNEKTMERAVARAREVEAA